MREISVLSKIGLSASFLLLIPCGWIQAQDALYHHGGLAAAYQSKQIRHNFPYADADIQLKAMNGFLWTITFMSDDNHLKDNEHNFLTFLSTMFASARDPHLRDRALEKAREVASRLTARNFIERYEIGNDLDSLMEYLTTFNRLGLSVPGLKETTVRLLERERPGIIKRIQGEMIASLDADSLYDTMLLTYRITNLKHNFPHIESLNYLPDLRDFFEILGKYTYHLEDEPNPDLSRLTTRDIARIIDDLYNITHIIFVISDYSAYSVPRMYFQREIAYMLKFKELVCSRFYKDPDLLSEIVYVFGLMGYSRQNSLIKTDWIRILDSQKGDGSWEAYGINRNASATDRNYDIFHATWTAVDMIVEPIVRGEAPFYKPLIGSLESYANTRR